MRHLLASLLILIPALCSAASTTATIRTTKGEVPLSLEVAATEAERAKGLMKRYELKPYDGMIFLFPEAGKYRFWMKDTPMSLDMLFVDKKKTIAFIAPHTKPYSTLPIGPGEKGPDILSVIELDAGHAAREGIAVGDKVTYAVPETVTIH